QATIAACIGSCKSLISLPPADNVFLQ
ncbi:hypothetical protein L195_g063304, partial [Trifolium pratense]